MVSKTVMTLAAVVVAAGCSARPAVENATEDAQGPSEVVAFETSILVRERPASAASDDEDDGVVAYGVGELFDLASAELKAEQYTACARHFDALWQAVPDEPSIAVPSLYNAGLCHERLERWPEAAERYLHLIELDGDSRDGLDAYFRLAEVDANQAHWSRVVENMERAITRDDARHLDRVEARYRAGMALVALRRLSEAETHFKEAIRENRDADRARLPDGNYFISGCTYGRALVYQFSAEQIAFRLPEERMKTDMAMRIELGRQAYDHYVRTIRYRNPYWSLLSGYMVGKLFEDFYYAVLASEIPHDLDDEATEAYLADLRSELDPLLDQALSAWEKTSAVAVRLGFDNEWVTRAEERMQRLRSYRTDDATRHAEEAAIIAWNKEMAAYRELVPPGTIAPVDGPPLPPEPTPPAMPLARPAAPEP